MCQQSLARLLGIALGIHQQADRQISQPVSQFAECYVRRSRSGRDVEKCLGLRGSVCTAVKCLGEKDGRYDEADKAGRCQRSYAGRNRQICKATRKGLRRRRYRFHSVR